MEGVVLYFQYYRPHFVFGVSESDFVQLIEGQANMIPFNYTHPLASATENVIGELSFEHEYLLPGESSHCKVELLYWKNISRYLQTGTFFFFRGAARVVGYGRIIEVIR